MSFSRRQLTAVVAAGLAHGRFDARQIRSLAAYLLRTGHPGDVAPLLRDVNLERARRGQLEVVSVSARPLTPQLRRDIRAKARELYPAVKQVTIAERLDPKLVGGARLTIGEYELDLTVSGRFRRFVAAALGGAR